MQNHEIRQALTLFDTSEKWQAFIALADQKDTLREMMYQKAVKEARSFMESTPVLNKTEWGFQQEKPNALEFEFFIRAYGPKSVRITYGWHGELWLRTSNKHRYKEAAALLRQPAYKILEDCFERIDARQAHPYEEFLLGEKWNFRFDSPSDEHFGPFRLAWYAYHQTQSFLQQIADKVARFQTPQATEALARLNEAVMPYETGNGVSS